MKKNFQPEKILNSLGGLPVFCFGCHSEMMIGHRTNVPTGEEGIVLCKKCSRAHAKGKFDYKALKQSWIDYCGEERASRISFECDREDL
jgi:hypothetical protein